MLERRLNRKPITMSKHVHQLALFSRQLDVALSALERIKNPDSASSFVRSGVAWARAEMRMIEKKSEDAQKGSRIRSHKEKDAPMTRQDTDMNNKVEPGGGFVRNTL